MERRQREAHQRQEKKPSSCGVASTDVYALASYDKSGCTERLCCGQDGSAGKAWSSTSRGCGLSGAAATGTRRLAGVAHGVSCPLETEARLHRVKRQRVDEDIGNGRDGEEFEGARSYTSSKRALSAENHELLQVSAVTIQKD